MKNNTDAHALFMERFPQYGLASYAWESSLPNLEGVEALYIFGLNSASYFQVKEWLKGNSERVLIFLEKEPGPVATFLHQSEAAEILSDPQVHFAFTKDIDAVVKQFPFGKIEVIAPKPLKLKILRKAALEFAHRVDRLLGHELIDNWVRNLRQIPHSFYANAMKGKFAGVPAIVCGAGPSLQQSIPLLRTLENRALVIAGGSAIAALSSQGILPHFGLALDPNLDEFKRFKNSFAFEMPLLYSTRAHPGIFQTCNGPFGYLRSGFGGMQEFWMDEELGLTDPFPGPYSEETNSVISLCIAWAQFLGCNPILLNGVDLSYTNNQRYAAGVIVKEEPISDGIVWHRKTTAVRWVMEAESLSYFAKKHKEVTFVNTTDSGLPIRGIAALPLAAAVEKFLEKTYDLRAEVHRQIIASPMPKKEIDLPKLKMSLERVLGCLKILSGQEKGSSVLAEMDLREEFAYSILFRDAENLFAPHEKWLKFYELAVKYRL